MSYACMSLPSSDDAGKIWGHLFLNEMVGHVFKQACNYESCKVSTTLKNYLVDKGQPPPDTTGKWLMRVTLGGVIRNSGES